jgi:hypothetical protein
MAQREHKETTRRKLKELVERLEIRKDEEIEGFQEDFSK